MKYTELYKISEIIINDNNKTTNFQDDKVLVNNTFDLSIIKAIEDIPEKQEIIKPVQIKQNENEEWEVVAKKKKTKNKEKEEYVFGTKKEVKKEETKPNKFNSKVNLVSGAELVENLKPKNSTQKAQIQTEPIDYEKLGFEVVKKKK